MNEFCGRKLDDFCYCCGFYSTKQYTFNKKLFYGRDRIDIPNNMTKSGMRLTKLGSLLMTFLTELPYDTEKLTMYTYFIQIKAQCPPRFDWEDLEKDLLEFMIQNKFPLLKVPPHMVPVIQRHKRWYQ